MTQEQLRDFNEYMNELLADRKIQRMSQFIQHGDTTCLMHCKTVAYYSVVFVNKFHIKVDMKSLIRGALLHDYFLYDWHEQKLGNLHGFYHPGIALRNAMRDYELTKREMDIIKKHMFPLTLYLPMYKETWVVCLMDKYCTLREFFGNLFKKKTCNA
ncbi:MAG: phosphohydrolase [Lachnospiraceae bacterium]|nr:phosphohydrolase [Lachnospiraceae bacterium]